MDGSSIAESLPRAALPLSTPDNKHANGSRQLHCSEHQPAATKRMAYVVNSIKEGFRKLGAGVLASDGHHARSRAARRRPTSNGKNVAAGASGRRTGGNTIWGAKRKVKGLENDSSFEMYLSSLPKADPVDRTVHWLFHHHDEAGSRDQEAQRERNIASIGDVQVHTAMRHPSHLMAYDHVLHPISRPGTSSWQHNGESSPYDTSLSYYESARGTGGRGTPPPREHGQPRLDDLFRQLQVRQERDARRKSQAQQEQKYQYLSTNNLHIPGYLAGNKVPGYSAGIRHDLAPVISQQTPLILHKNSSYYNQGHTQQCEWGQCRRRFLSSKDVLTHVQEHHISHLTTSVKGRSNQRLLVCEWKGCESSGRGYMARYKLLMHIKMAHIQSQYRKSDSHTTYWKI